MGYAILIVSAFASGGFASYVASKKGYDGNIWFLWGLLFNFIALIAIAGLPSLLSVNDQKRQILEKKHKESKNRYKLTKRH